MPRLHNHIFYQVASIHFQTRYWIRVCKDKRKTKMIFKKVGEKELRKACIKYNLALSLLQCLEKESIKFKVQLLICCSVVKSLTRSS